MKKIVVLFIAFLGALASYGQAKYFTKNGKIYFDATSSVEKIEATNEKAFSVLTDAGVLEFSVLMKAFNFEKALMQEHFNENYAESDKYPKAVFKGNVTNFSTVDLHKPGIYPVKIKGMLTLHGVTKEVNADGKLTVKDGIVSAGTSTFKILLEDYKIDIPSLVKDKISKDVEIKIDLNYELFKSS